MKQYSRSRSSIFLMEIIIAILCFALVSALCLRLFVQSRNVSHDSAALSQAVSSAASMCEILDSASSIEDASARLDKFIQEQEEMQSVDESTQLAARYFVGEADERGVIPVEIRITDPQGALTLEEVTCGELPEHVVYQLTKEVYYGQ